MRSRNKPSSMQGKMQHKNCQAPLETPALPRSDCYTLPGSEDAVHLRVCMISVHATRSRRHPTTDSLQTVPWSIVIRKNPLGYCYDEKTSYKAQASGTCFDKRLKLASAPSEQPLPLNAHSWPRLRLMCIPFQLQIQLTRSQGDPPSFNRQEDVGNVESKARQARSRSNQMSDPIRKTSFPRLQGETDPRPESGSQRGMSHFHAIRGRWGNAPISLLAYLVATPLEHETEGSLLQPISCQFEFLRRKKERGMESHVISTGSISHSFETALDDGRRNGSCMLVGKQPPCLMPWKWVRTPTKKCRRCEVRRNS
ncbi:hypothetical protein BDZ45DRAFT_214633 [Acephala macrosclerotiorum]|nr:hypothetical protein BDZ45DRAFT_214633 [Acephala macrosclerotiorum]